MHTLEIAHDLAALGSTEALQRIEAMLSEEPPDVGEALGLAERALQADTAADAALLAAIHRLLTPTVWIPHRGQTRHVATGHHVLADLGSGWYVSGPADALCWSGPGRPLRWALVDLTGQRLHPDTVTTPPQRRPGARMAGLVAGRQRWLFLRAA